MSRFLAITAAEDILGIVPRGTHTHGKFVTPAELTAALHAATSGNKDGPAIRFSISKPTAFTYEPFLAHKWSIATWGPLVNYGVVAQKCISV